MMRLKVVRRDIDRAIRLFVWGGIMVLSLTSVGCDAYTQTGETVQYQRVSPKGWCRHRPISFSVFFPARELTYPLTIDLRYSNLMEHPSWKLELMLKKGETVYQRYLISMDMATSPGVWKRRIWGIGEYSMQIVPGISPPLAGVFDIELRPVEPSCIVGVESIGLVVGKSIPKD